MLENMAGDHEILGGTGDRSDSIDIEVGHDVRPRERCILVELPEQRPVVPGLPSVHVPDGDPVIQQREWNVAGTISKPSPTTNRESRSRRALDADVMIVARVARPSQTSTQEVGRPPDKSSAHSVASTHVATDTKAALLSPPTSARVTTARQADASEPADTPPRMRCLRHAHAARSTATPTTRDPEVPSVR